MHQTIKTIRRILPAELPQVRISVDDSTMRAATAEEMLQMGMVPLGSNLYSCIEQHTSDDAEAARTGERTWVAESPLPGTMLTEGARRFAVLSPACKDLVMLANVVRSPTVNARALIAASLAAQGVSSNSGRERAEAMRLAALHSRVSASPTEDLRVHRVRMCDVLVDSDVVTHADLIPHLWAGDLSE